MQFMGRSTTCWIRFFPVSPYENLDVLFWNPEKDVKGEKPHVISHKLV